MSSLTSFSADAEAVVAVAVDISHADRRNMPLKKVPFTPIDSFCDSSTRYLHLYKALIGLVPFPTGETAVEEQYRTSGFSEKLTTWAAIQRCESRLV